MAVGRSDLPRLLSIPGITWGTARAGIRHPDRDDLAVMEIAPGSSCAAVFTRNAFCAAPVTVAREALAVASPRFLLVNSGNANAGTGAAGLADARHCCAALAGQAACRVEAVLPFSTGVIGERLPVERIEDALPQALGTLADDGWGRAAHAIMTTDTVPKGAAREIDIAGRPVRVTGIAKGAGMIRPDMATMLAFVATDAGVSQPDLQAMLRQAVERSFNRITVDGDTSTNDACVLVATGASGVDLAGDATGLAQLAEAVDEVCRRLAQAIVRDGEGATKFVTITVQGGRDSAECLQVAYTVAHSPLVKTALFASDPNWGRILAAVGRSGVEGLDIGRIDIDLGDVALIRGGEPDPGYSEAAGAAVMAKPEITITIGLGRGKAHEQVWTTDLSYDYVRINAEYRT